MQRQQRVLCHPATLLPFLDCGDVSGVRGVENVNSKLFSSWSMCSHTNGIVPAHDPNGALAELFPAPLCRLSL